MCGKVRRERARVRVRGCVRVCGMVFWSYGSTSLFRVVPRVSVGARARVGMRGDERVRERKFKNE